MSNEKRKSKDACTRDLLEYLAEKTGCAYLSDLHEFRYLSRISNVLEEVNCQNYPTREWADAVYYLSGKRVDFKTPEEAKTFLMNMNI